MDVNLAKKMLSSPEINEHILSPERFCKETVRQYPIRFSSRIAKYVKDAEEEGQTTFHVIQSRHI
jgi:DNA polymerase/3'-5' exonuclease PolX